MKVHLHQGLAFVNCGQYLICVGTDDEVANASDHEISQMFLKAIALAHFNQIETGEDQSLN